MDNHSISPMFKYYLQKLDPDIMYEITRKLAQISNLKKKIYHEKIIIAKSSSEIYIGFKINKTW